MNRFLSRRDKSSSHRLSKSSDASGRHRTSILSLFKADSPRKSNADTAKKIHAVREKLRESGSQDIEDSHIEYALQSMYAGANTDKAVEILKLYLDSADGVVHSYDPKLAMKGAENRGGVTCYLDSILFAMFARLGSFEPILYTKFDDEPRQRLATMIRLWVNMLRTGKLIQVDVVC